MSCRVSITFAYDKVKCRQKIEYYKNVKVQAYAQQSKRHTSNKTDMYDMS